MRLSMEYTSLIMYLLRVIYLETIKSLPLTFGLEEIRVIEERVKKYHKGATRQIQKTGPVANAFNKLVS